MHSREVHDIRQRMLGASPAEGRDVQLRSGRRVHVLQAGDGPAVLFLHGSGTSAISFLPLLEHLDDVRAIAVDRPGFGLSEPARSPRARFRDAAVEFIDEVVAELGLEPVALAGASMGATLALWYALARPRSVRRLALVGSAPLLPGTRPPTPLRVLATPVVGDVLGRLAKPNPKRLVQLMSAVGEKDTVVRYPALIDAIVAEGNDPVAAEANLAELRAVITARGFRPSMRLQPDELRALTVPTLVIWGDHDPVGTVEAGRAVATLIPEAQLGVLPAGHVPYFGNPERVAELLSAFVR